MSAGIEAFRRPALVRMTLKSADGRHMTVEFDAQPGQILTSMSLEIDGQTITTVPFSCHGVVEHTICRLNSDGLEHVRW